MNQIKMIKSKGLVPNIEIEKILNPQHQDW